MAPRRHATPAKLRAWRRAQPAPARPTHPGPAPAAGLTQAEAAARLGVALRTYARWEAGRGPIPRWILPYLDGRL
jgi:hypothetical protein